MTSGKKIVLDANILIRGVLGERVPDLLERYHHDVRFYAPSQCFSEAREHLPAILNRRRHVDPGMTRHTLNALYAIVQPVDGAWGILACLEECEVGQDPLLIAGTQKFQTAPVEKSRLIAHLDLLVFQASGMP